MRVPDLFRRNSRKKVILPYHVCYFCPDLICIPILCIGKTYVCLCSENIYRREVFMTYGESRDRSRYSYRRGENISNIY